MKYINTNQATLRGVKALIWGESGSGKTTLAGTLPAERVFILSAENGLLSLKSKNINGVLIETVDDLAEAYLQLQTPAFAQFDCIFLDSLTEIGEQVLANAKKLVKDPRQAYGELIEKVIDLCKKFRDLDGKNVFFLAKMERFQDPVSGVTMFGPSMPGKSVGPQLPYLFDEVWKLDVATDPQTKSTYRYIQTAKDAQNVCKDRSGSLAAYEQADLSVILSKINEEK